MSGGSPREGARGPHAAPVLDYLSSVSRLGSEKLKQVARFWMGPAANRANKEGCVLGIRDALLDPDRVRACVAGLSDFERAVLGLLKLRGGLAPPNELAADVAALGIEPRPSRFSPWRPEGGPFELLNPLLERGILLGVTPGSPWDQPQVRLDAHHGAAVVFADARLLDPVPTVSPRPLRIASVAEAGAAWARRPGEVVLDLLALVAGVRRLRGVAVTRDGRPTVGALRKLAKATGWQARPAPADDAPGVRPRVPFYMAMLEGLGVIGIIQFDLTAGRLGLSDEADARLGAPYHEQGRAWVDAYRRLRERVESPDGFGSSTAVYGGGQFGLVRGMLLGGLARLPEPRDAWVSFDALAEALFERAGTHVSLDYIAPFYAANAGTPAELEKQRVQWRAGLREHWRRREAPWIADALRGPLYELGLVEVARPMIAASGPPTLVRLTPLGRLAFAPVGAREHGLDASGAAPLVVQPNFEALVYLDRAAPGLLALLDRTGARGAVGEATATYRLTRASVYEALEDGLGIEEVVKTLAEGAEHGVPANVDATLREWAARRDRLVVRRAVRLLEFTDAASRDVAVAPGSATPLGDRYLLLPPGVSHRAARALVGTSIDYATPPRRCLEFAEDGAVTLDRSSADLVVRAEVARCAEPEGDGDGARWRITRGSVERAVRAGIGAAEIVSMLAARATHVVPPLLVVVIRAWGGTRSAAMLASALVLSFEDRATIDALATSPTLQPHLLGRLGPHALAVRPEAEDVLRRTFGGFGFPGEESLLLEPLPPPFEPRPVSARRAEPGAPFTDPIEGEDVETMGLPGFPDGDAEPMRLPFPDGDDGAAGEGGSSDATLDLLESCLAEGDEGVEPAGTPRRRRRGRRRRRSRW